MNIHELKNTSAMNASARFVGKLSQPTIEPNRTEFATTLESKIASIEDALREAAIAGAQELQAVANDKLQTSASSSSVANKIPIAYNSEGVYNEGHLRCNDELNQYFKEASDKYNLDVKFLKAVAFTESSFRANATSRCGAMGIMQLMPSAAKQYGAKDPYDARQNIMAGAKILSTFLKRYDGDKELTLAAYNAGPGNVKKAGGVPEYTRGYIKKVLKYYNE